MVGQSLMKEGHCWMVALLTKLKDLIVIPWYDDMGVWWNIKYRFSERFISPFQEFHYRFKKVLYYVPVIWNEDKDFEAESILALMERKFRRCANFFEKDSIVMDSERTAKELRICAELCRRAYTNNYSLRQEKYYSDKYGDTDIVDVGIDERGWTRTVIDPAPKVKTEKEQEQARKLRMRMGKHEEYMLKQDLEYLGKLMSKKLHSWWE